VECGSSRAPEKSLPLRIDVCMNLPGNGPPRLHERLLLSALDADSPALAAVLAELDVSLAQLRAAVTARLQIAS
jgi:hypothetical protein